MTNQLWDFSKRVMTDNGYSSSDWVSIIDFYHSQGGGDKKLYAYLDPETPFRILAVLNDEDVLVMYSKTRTLGTEKFDSVVTAKKQFTDTPHSSETKVDLPEDIQQMIDPTVAFQLTEGQKYILVKN